VLKRSSVRRTRHAPRGQAIFETAIALPLFLLGLFGVMWSVRASALSERVQLGVRYGGVVNAVQNPYLSYSLFSMYATLDGQSPVDLTKCPNADTSALTSGRATFWHPSGTPLTDCKSSVNLLPVASPNQYILLQNDFVALTAVAPVDGYLSANNIISATRSQLASANFFRSPDIGQLMSCTPIGQAVKASLEGGSDASTANTAATPMPLIVPITSVVQAPLKCTTYGPDPSPPPATPGPTPVPTPTPTPTPAPTPTPQPTLSPPPTPPPTPTPIPTATAVPTATAIPTSTPSPTPTRTPAPTPTPCDDGKGDDGNGNGNGNGKNKCPSPTPSPPPTPSPTPTPDPSPPPGNIF